MNQIIFTTYSKSEALENTNEIYFSNYIKYNKKKRFFKLQLSFFIIIFLALIIYYISFKNGLAKNERISKSISQSYRYH